MTDRYARYQRLKFAPPAERVLEIVLDTPGKLNATDAAMHAELAEIRRDVDADPAINAALLRGAGGAFSPVATWRWSKASPVISPTAPAAVRWTKCALNNWLRLAGPSFDTSLALEFLGFTGPEVKEAMASLREKRAPEFPPSSPV